MGLSTQPLSIAPAHCYLLGHPGPFPPPKIYSSLSNHSLEEPIRGHLLPCPRRQLPGGRILWAPAPPRPAPCSAQAQTPWSAPPTPPPAVEGRGAGWWRWPQLHGAPGAAEPTALGLLWGPGRPRGSRSSGWGLAVGAAGARRAAARDAVRTARTVVVASGGAGARAVNLRGSGVLRDRCGDRCQGNRLRSFAGLRAPPPRRSQPPLHSRVCASAVTRAQPKASKKDSLQTPPY